ncbi:bifunctional transcriptional activator/DNA repair enzyme AdaA [Chromobacterium vaccinii]|uniref:bifunctional transcriptional activator/DNA repair enzyme AdaA n=1 Tax=Chromobacterium vaccinii TaxID=1108595 RepID=UPI0009E1FA2A|nr:AlkA N-terminal domain-containing protein [Chromobacterium vaccinii]
MELDPDFCHRALASRDARFDGRFFIAVRSTGIYCRPICPARTAKRENIAVYPTAAAAQEAGFRPCLRCRPEAAPDSGAWRGVANSGHSHTVARALALIEQGALDDGGMAGLVNKLGVGERQLRRLFAEHVGASPLTVAQTRRVLLAKQLIHETRLPLTDIAFAAGFGSVRRFNEVFQQLYRRAPGELRRDASACQNAPGEVSLLLRYRPPYDWPDMLAQLAAQTVPGLEAIQGDIYARAFCWRGVAGTLSVTPTRHPALLVTVRTRQWHALGDILARLRAMLDLAADPDSIERHLAQDPMLAERVAARPGLRLLGAWSVAESVWKHETAPSDRASWLNRHGCPLPSADPAFPSLSHAFPPSPNAENDMPRAAEPDECNPMPVPAHMDAWRPWRAYAQHYLD